MIGKVRATMFVATVLMVLALSATWTGVVRADDATPPPDAPTQTAPADEGGTDVAPADSVGTEPAPTDEARPIEEVTTEAAPTEAVAATEVAPGLPAATEVPALDVAPTQAAATEMPVVDTASTDSALAVETTAVVEQLPEGTDLVVLDATGASVPLATQEAAEIIAAADPMWCPVGVAPGGSTCSDAYDTLALLWSSPFTPTGNGVIWITGGSDASTAGLYTIGSGGIWTGLEHYSLTFNGGWEGCPTPTTCSSTLDPKDPSIFSGMYWDFPSWNADITLNNITFTGYTSATVFSINTTGKVKLVNVKVVDNDGGGAHIHSTGDVSISQSAFNNNQGGNGLDVQTYGNITLTDVDAADNGGVGAKLDNVVGGLNKLAKNITLNGTNVFTDNTTDGIDIAGTGTITISNLIANYNHSWGAQIRNTDAPTPLPIILKGTNEFKFNLGGCGLCVESKGAITTYNLFASGTVNGSGVRLNNNSTSVQPVKVLGTNSFYNNGGDGLSVESRGAITLNNITAVGNDGSGTYVDNWHTGAVGGVTLTGYGTFNDNGEIGLSAWSVGAMTLANVTTNGNGVGAPDPAYYGFGAYLHNSINPLAPVNVTLTGVNTFNNNWSTGLTIETYGNILLNNVTANDNGLAGSVSYGYGAFLDEECNWDNGACTTTLPRPITLAGTNTFNGNHLEGLYLTTFGAITLNNITANGNDRGGAYLDNQWSQPVPANLTIIGYGQFNGNQGSMGLEAYSHGNITIANLTASNNSYGDVDPEPAVEEWVGGAYLNVSRADPAVSNITLTGITNIQDNGDFVGWRGHGLDISADGQATIANLRANNNAGDGALLSTGRGIMLTGTNTFNGNGWDGLLAYSNGQITTNNITASDNSYLGAYFKNQYTGAVGGVTLLGYGTFNHNGWDGTNLWSNGAISAANLTANDNGWQDDDPTVGGYVGEGAYLNNQVSPTAPQNVTLTGTNTFSGNWFFGLEIYTYGSILTNNLSANDNGKGHDAGYGYGAFLDNCTYDPVAVDCTSTAAPRPITLGVSNTFNGNYDSGLWATSLGAITITKIKANNNGMAGAYLNNQWDQLIPASLTILTSAEFSDNNGSLGVEGYSHGNITIANLTASGNSYDDPDGIFIGGAYLDAHRAVGNSSITLTGINVFEGNTGSGMGLCASADGLINITNLRANGNGGSGAEIRAGGSVTLSNVAADDNHNGAGVHVDNRTPTVTLAPPNVTISGTSHFNGNYLTGLDVWTYGAITASNLTANGNGNTTTNEGYGAMLNNCSRTVPLCENTSVPRTVTLTGFNTFMGNELEGLFVDASGNVSLQRVITDDNLRHAGVLLLTDLAGLVVHSDWNITVSCISTNNNGYDDGIVTVFGGGYYLETHGTNKVITIKGATSLENKEADEIVGDPDPIVVRTCPLP